MAATVSVSKGVFAFKRRATQDSNKRAKKKMKAEPSYWPKQDNCTSQQHHTNYNRCWGVLNDKLQELEKDIHECVFKELVEFVCNKGSSSSQQQQHRSSTGIPTALLVTGVNMPDRGQVISSLEHLLLKEASTRHIVRLHSRNCSTVKHCIVNLVSQLVNSNKQDEATSSDDDDDEEEEDEDTIKKSPKKKIACAVRKANCTMSVLEAWHQEQLSEDSIVVMLEDVDSFSNAVLQDLIQICSHHHRLPILLVLCVATSPAALHSRLPQPVLACLSLTTFQARPSRHYLSMLVDKVLMDAKLMSFRLGGKTFKLLLDTFLYHDLSVNTFVQGLKYCLLEHLLSSEVSVLCCPASQRKAVAAALSTPQVESIRKLASFRQYVDGLPNKEQVPLVTDNKKCKSTVVSLLGELDGYYARLCCLVRVLHLIAANLPRAPLGRQVWSVLSLCLSSPCVVESPEFFEAWQHVLNMSREELLTPLPAVITLLRTSRDGALQEAADTLEEYMEDLFDMEELEESSAGRGEEGDNDGEEVDKLELLQPTDRFQLKEKLQALAKKKQNKPNKFQTLRGRIVGVVRDLVKEHVVPPTSQPLHEVVFYNNVSEVKGRMLGQHKAAITKALADPAHYLQCLCCDGVSLSPSLPDLSLVYRLYLECGRLINLYDWLQAFCSCVASRSREEEEEDEGEQQPDQVMQARFVQAVSELQFLGFIKTTKRKTDHVARLTWGSC